MRFPFSLNLSLSSYLFKQRVSGKEKFPLVLMLEPLHACNLECAGCGRIKEYESTINDTMPLEIALKAVDDCGAPVVSVTGGEPLLYQPIGELIEELVRRKKHIYLCTNGMLLERSLKKFRPNKFLHINVSLDGMAETHDKISGEKGVFDKAISGIKKARAAGFRVCTNTSIYKETDLKEIETLFHFLKNININGILAAPAFEYDVLSKKIFLDRQATHRQFEFISSISKKLPIMSTPLYLKFLKGKRHLECTPWGNPTYNPQGWKSPCYLITDTHYKTFKELMTKTDWSKYGTGKDPRCANCMMHSGFEPTVVREVGKNFSDFWEMIVWNFT